MKWRNNTGMNILVTLAMMIAGAVVIFWVRELDLSFLVSSRMLVVIGVLLSGIILGISSGLQTGEGFSGADKSQRILLGIIMLAGGGIAISFQIPSAVSAYWRAAMAVPVSMHTVTDMLFNLLFAVYMPIFAGMFGVMLLRGARTNIEVTAEPLEE